MNLLRGKSYEQSSSRSSVLNTATSLHRSAFSSTLLSQDQIHESRHRHVIECIEEIKGLGIIGLLDTSRTLQILSPFETSIHEFPCNATALETRINGKRPMSSIFTPWVQAVPFSYDPLLHFSDQTDTRTMVEHCPCPGLRFIDTLYLRSVSILQCILIKRLIKNFPPGLYQHSSCHVYEASS